MTKNCCVPFCRNRGKIVGIKYYRVTNNRKPSWFKALGRNVKEEVCQDTFICSDHFKAHEIQNDGSLIKEAIPSLNLKGPKVFPASKVNLNIVQPGTSQQILTDINRSLNQETPSQVEECLIENIIPVEESLEIENLSQESDQKNYTVVDNRIVSSSDGELNVFYALALLFLYFLLNIHKAPEKVTTASRNVAGDLCSRSGLQESSYSVYIRKRKLDTYKSSSADSIGLTGNPSKIRRYAKQDHSYSASPQKLKNTLVDFKEKQKTMQETLHTSKETVCRLRKNYIHLHDIIHDVKFKEKLSENAIHILEKTFSGIPLELMKRLMKNSQKTKGTRECFPEELKCFALTLYFYSNKAYDYVREVFKFSLPSPSTLRKWMNNVDCTSDF